MAEVTARLARSIGLDSFADLTNARPSSPVPNPDGTVTITFVDDVPAETLTLIRERMETADDDEQAQRQAIRTALVALMAQAPLPEAPTDADRLAWLTQRATLQDALLLPLAALFGASPVELEADDAP